MAMILDVGQLSGLIEVTANFSNAVLVAMLPHVSDAAKKLDMPIPQPITQQQVVGCGVFPYIYRNGEWGGCGIRLKGDWGFAFHSGHLDTIETPHCYYALQDPADIPKFFGTVRMNEREAVEMARDALTKLGIKLEEVFAEQKPRVTSPPRIRDKTVPHYRIEWLDPRFDSAAVDIEINADAKRIERLHLSPNPALRRPWPKFAVAPLVRGQRLSANPEYAAKLLPLVMRSVDDYCAKLSLPVSRPLTTNQVARFEVGDNGGWPHAELELTNGWRFIYRNSMVNGCYAPDNFFNSESRSILIKDFIGKTNIGEKEAIKLIRNALTKLAYPAELVHIDFKPQIVKPTLAGIPRYAFWWNLPNKAKDDLLSKVEAEVDMEKGELKSLYFDNKELWNKPPPINVPISPPPQHDGNSGVTATPSKQSKPRPSQRSLKPFLSDDKR